MERTGEDGYKFAEKSATGNVKKPCIPQKSKYYIKKPARIGFPRRLNLSFTYFWDPILLLPSATMVSADASIMIRMNPVVDPLLGLRPTPAGFIFPG